MSSQPNVTDLKPYSMKELAEMYDVCGKTFKRWLVPFGKEVGERHGRYYNINQVKVIFEKLGLPGKVMH